MEKIRKQIPLLLAGILLILIGYFAGFLQKQPQSTSEVEQTQISLALSATELANLIKVTRVIDGDTIEIEGGKRIRLIGMDTPELNKSGETGCYGREAYDYANKLLAGQMVRLEKDVSEMDRYGRLLRFVYLGDTLINEKLVRDGYARVYTYPPDVKYNDKFLESEKYASENNLGLWSACVSDPTPTSRVSNIQPSQSSGGNFSCDCSRSCVQISSCAEALYQLKTCGCSKRDGDGDGIACDGAPLNCQN